MKNHEVREFSLRAHKFELWWKFEFSGSKNDKIS